MRRGLVLPHTVMEIERRLGGVMLYSSRALKTEGNGMWRRAVETCAVETRGGSARLENARSASRTGRRQRAGTPQAGQAGEADQPLALSALLAAHWICPADIRGDRPRLGRTDRGGAARARAWSPAGERQRLWLHPGGWGAGALVGAILAAALGKRQHKGVILLLAGLLMATLIA